MTKMISRLTIFLFFLGSSLWVAAQDQVGVLVLAHGGAPQWNETIQQEVAPLRKDYKVEIAFGMADPHTMQTGIDQLEQQGVKTIVVLPLFASTYSVIIRQNEYLLGFREKLADEPMMMIHDEKQMEGMALAYLKEKGTPVTDPKEAMEKMSREDWQSVMDEHKKHMTLEPLTTHSKILLAKPLDDHPLVQQIIIDRVKELSASPQKETVILVAHGPNGEKDNHMWLQTLQNFSTSIQSAFGVGHFRAVDYLTLRDDAEPAIYDSAKQAFREMVTQASENGGKALIVPVILSKGGIEKRLEERLEGLQYEWTGNTLAPDERITAFMKQSVEEMLKLERLALP